MNPEFIRLLLVKSFIDYVARFNVHSPPEQPLSLSYECEIDGTLYTISMKRKRKPKKECPTS